MRIALLGSLLFLCSAAWGNEQLWEMLGTRTNLVVLIRNAHATGGDPLLWDETGKCKGERLLSESGKAHARNLAEKFKLHGIDPIVISSPMCRCLETAKIAFGVEPITDPVLRETQTADSERLMLFESKTQSLLARYRGARPVVFVSHRPNINTLTLELIETEDLLVGQIDEGGEIEVLDKVTLRP